MAHILESRISSSGFLLTIFVIHCCFLISTGNLIYYARRPQKLILDELAKEEGIIFDDGNVPVDPDADAEMNSELDQFPNCTSFDATRCCISAVNLPCSEFIKNPYFKDVCGEECGIPCVDDITAPDNDIAVIVEASEAECIDDRPPVCCDFLRNNHLCRTELFRGCAKTCEICSSNITDTQPLTAISKEK